MGDCRRCGKCCTGLTFTLPGVASNRLFREYYQAHGCRIEGNTLHVPLRCPHLTEENLCDIHDTKPLLCKTFRGKKQGKFYVDKGCGYND